MKEIEEDILERYFVLIDWKKISVKMFILLKAIYN